MLLMASYQLENQRSYLVTRSDVFLQRLVKVSFYTVCFVTKRYVPRVDTDALTDAAVIVRYVDDSTQQAG